MDKADYDFVKMITSKLYKKYCPLGDQGAVTFEDVYHSGIIGFLKAKKDFKQDMGPFKPYAYKRVFGEILDAVRKQPLIRVPKEKYKWVKELKMAAKMLQDKGVDPSTDTLADALDWPFEKVLQVQALVKHVTSLDQEPGNGSPIQLISKTSAEQQILNQDLAHIVALCLEQINDIKARLIFSARNFKEMTLAQLADKSDCSIETIRRKQAKATQSMKSCLKKNGWTLT